MGIDEEQITEQMDRYPSSGGEFDELLRRVEFTDFGLGVAHGLLDAGHHRAELIGHGLEQLLDVLLGGLLRSLLDLAHDEEGETSNKHHNDNASQADQLALPPCTRRGDPRPEGGEKSGEVRCAMRGPSNRPVELLQPGFA